MVRARITGKLGIGCLAALGALLLGLASCDRGVGDLRVEPLQGDAGASAEACRSAGAAANAGAAAAAACEDGGSCEGGLISPPHVVTETPFEFEAGPYQFKKAPNGGSTPPAEANCRAREVVVGIVVALKEGNKPAYSVPFGPYRYPVYFALRCAVLNQDGSLGEPHTREALSSNDNEHAEEPVTYDCPRGMAGVSVRGTLDREENEDNGEVWVSSLGLECVNARAWFYGHDSSRSVLLVGADGKMPFVNGCTPALALLSGIGARIRGRFVSLTNWCVPVTGTVN